MHRWIVEVTLATSLSLTVAGAVLAVGHQTKVTSPPALLMSRPLGSGGCHEAELRPVAASGVGGLARLCLAESGVSVRVDAEHLRIGHTYTLWLTYVDRDRPSAEESSGRNDPNRPSSLAERTEGGVAQTGQASFTADVTGLRPASRSEIAVRLFASPPSAPSSLMAPPVSPGGSLVALATFDLETHNR